VDQPSDAIVRLQSGHPLASLCAILRIVRADRLVAALLVLQARSRVTVAELARELEVSERTARRDLEALGMAGVPVYSQPGRGGGWSLVGGSRTDLTGLTAPEARALFMVAGPSAATPEVKAALRKLVRALPEQFRRSAEAAASAVVIDPTDWDRDKVSPPAHLEILRRAIGDEVQIELRYGDRAGAESERTVHPLGLVAKGAVWYLVGNTQAGMRTFRVSRIRSVHLTDRPLLRPDGFDLDETWQSTLATLDDLRAPFRATVHAAADILPVLRSVFGTLLTVTGTTAEGTVEVEIRDRSAFMIAVRLAGFGNRVAVAGPESVRAELARIGSELQNLYA
jgi:predicted DNA-binding transcriptional regulator YafY